MEDDLEVFPCSLTLVTESEAALGHSVCFAAACYRIASSYTVKINK